MNKIVKKVLLELDKPEPDLSYIRGLLEAISVDDTVVTSTTTSAQPITTPTEGSTLDSLAKANLDKVLKATNLDIQ